MRAARVHHFGDTLQIDDVPNPEVGPGEVLVDVEFIGVNPLDVWVTQGTVGGGNQPLPFIPGLEAVGTVDDRQYVVHGFGVGTASDGMYRERAAVPEAALFPIPEFLLEDPQLFVPFSLHLHSLSFHGQEQDLSVLSAP